MCTVGHLKCMSWNETYAWQLFLSRIVAFILSSHWAARGVGLFLALKFALQSSLGLNSNQEDSLNFHIPKSKNCWWKQEVREDLFVQQKPWLLLKFLIFFLVSFGNWVLQSINTIPLTLVCTFLATAHHRSWPFYNFENCKHLSLEKRKTLLSRGADKHKSQ